MAIYCASSRLLLRAATAIGTVAIDGLGMAVEGF
jgi:hypothetical protein